MFRVIKRYDRRLMILNFMLLFLVVILPLTTSLISKYGNWQLPVVIYDSSLALAGFVITGMWAHATSGNRLIDAGLDQRYVRMFRFHSIYIACVFLAIIALTFAIPSAFAQLAYLVLVPLQRLPLFRRLSTGGMRTRRNTQA